MSDSIKHECGIALIRLLKPLEYYRRKYGTVLYGLNKLCLLMEKQLNRGQDGAGVATIKLDIPPGQRYISRYRSMAPKAVRDIFEYIHKKFDEVQRTDPERMDDADWLKNNVAFTGEVLMGHLRYGTHSKNSIENCHPFLRQNNWMSRNLVLAGNFNMTNVDELLETLYELGQQHPKEKSDTVTVLEKIGHFLDVENQSLFDHFKIKGYPNADISHLIADQLDVAKILRRSAKDFDGGYTIAGMFGHGDAFVLRDPSGIRPAYYYRDDEVAVVASERPAIQTAFNVGFEELKEIKPGYALIIKKEGSVTESQILEEKERTSCSFERIYFSKGSDREIYQERKMLGKLLVPEVLKAVNYNIEDTVFSYIPNTAEIAFFGMVEGIHEYIRKIQQEKLKTSSLSPKEIEKILSIAPRVERVPLKDTKVRTFITQDTDRNELVNHTYDVTYGVVKPGIDTLVVLDDSIVRGTTLRESILRILDRLDPAKIIVVSSAPQIRFPDCYGIDMSRMGEFVAFQAVVSLLHKTGREELLDDVYARCKEQALLPKSEIRNYVKELYDPFSYQEVSEEIGHIITPPDLNAEVQIIYQTLKNLHKACPGNTGDWYFSGNYPTPGGNKVVNMAFVNYMEGINQRAYL